MAHIGGTPFDIEEVLARLRPGDIVTHAYTGWQPGAIVDDAGRVVPGAGEARGRGVRFDVGHGAGSFTWPVAEAALADGFRPDTISSDLHRFNIATPVHDLATTLSKFLLLGLPIDDVIAMATTAPAAALGPAGLLLGTLAVGAEADVTVLRLEDGRVRPDRFGRDDAAGRPAARARGGRARRPPGADRAARHGAAGRASAPADGLDPARLGAPVHGRRGSRRPARPSEAGEGLTVVVPRARSTSRSVTRSNDQRTSSSSSAAVTSSPAIERATRRPAMSSRTCPRRPVTRMVSWCSFPKVPAGSDAPPIEPMAPPSKRTTSASWSSTLAPGSVGEGGHLAGSQVRQQVGHQPERVGQLALAVAAARDRGVRPGLAARQRDVGVAEVGRPRRQQVADHGRHLDRHGFDLTDAVRAVDEVVGRRG